MSKDARRMYELLYLRHPEPEWACFAELRDGTGMRYRRSIDFVALNCYPSKKFRTVAYEIKVSRNDFLNEIKDPKKRESAQLIAHECYFVVPHGLVGKDEIPEGWGLLECNEGGLRRVKFATQREEVNWSQEFMVSVARRCADEKPRLPAVVWKVAGQEVDEDQLLSIAETTLRISIDRERRLADKRVKGSEEYRTLVQLEQMVRQWLSVPYGGNTVEAFKNWNRKQLRMTPGDIRRLKNAQQLIGYVVGEAGEEDG